MHADGARLS